MTSQEETAVEAIVKIEGSIDGDEDAGEPLSKAAESPQGLALESEARDVEGAGDEQESDGNSATLEPADPTPPIAPEVPEVPITTVEPTAPVAPAALAETKDEATKDDAEETKGSEGAVIANGNTAQKREELAENPAMSLESEVVTILPHWDAKPCVHITGLGGVVSEEDLLPMLTPHGKVASVVFETERKDSAIVRFELSGTDGEEIAKRVHEAVHNKQVKKRTLLVEPFRSDSLLFIGNLTPEITDAVLRQMFEPHGTVERAFVLRNASGRSKGYGFVEYSLKFQANAAKLAMGNINMDGRVLRVEWSDCRKISDMFSTVLFVDRISKDAPHIEQTLRAAFGKFGRVRDCHLAVGINQQLRGFGFIDFYHSTFADRAHEALDGQMVEGSSIRVSFANPSKSAQSYKTRFGMQAAVQANNTHTRGSFQDHTTWPVVPAGGASMRSHTNVPAMGNRYMTPARSNMLGMNIGMPFGRGAPVGPGMMGRSLVSPLVANGPGMLGPGSVPGGMIGRTPAVMLGHGGQRGPMAGGYGQQGSRILAGRGPSPINSTAIAQGATAQAKAREEEAKARAEAHVKQSHAGAKQSTTEQERVEQFRKMAAQQAQLFPQQNYYHQQVTSAGLEQQYKQSGVPYSFQQPYRQTGQVQAVQYQPQPAAQQGLDAQQAQQAYGSQYLLQPSQQYGQVAQQPQQQQQQQQQPQSQASAQVQLSQPQQQQQSTDQVAASAQQQYAQYAQQYGQQFAQQYAQQQLQQSVQQYGQQTAQQYAEPAQVQAAAQYNQQDYANYYAQQQQTQSQQTHPVAVATPTTGGALVQTADASQQQQAYAAYYQQKAQEAVAQAGSAAAQTAASTAGATTSGSTAAAAALEAQWAAYYAVQASQQQAGATAAATTTYDQQQPYTAQQSYAAAYYQQPVSVDVGQKRTADQIDYSTQSQANYGYQQQSAAVPASYTQHQAVNGTTPVPQQSATVASAYQQPSSTGTGYQQPALTSYQQPAVGYQQQPATAIPLYSQQTPASGYTPAVASGYQQLTTPAPAGYQSLPPSGAAYQQPAAALASSYSQSNQTAVAAPVYDYNKRTRY